MQEIKISRQCLLFLPLHDFSFRGCTPLPAHDVLFVSAATVTHWLNPWRIALSSKRLALPARVGGVAVAHPSTDCDVSVVC
jgi:hypothetical protein